MEQGTKEWHEMRRKHIGASDSPTIMRLTKRTPLELWEEKLGLREPQKESYAMRFGRINEAPARIAYEKYTGNMVIPEVIKHPEKDFMMASLDGISLDGKIILEIKNNNREYHEMAKNGIIPEPHYVQTQHQLDCKRGSILHYWSFWKGEGVLVENERNEGYTNTLVEELQRFWDCIQNFEPPKPTDRDLVECFEGSEEAILIQDAIEIAQLKDELKQREEANKNAMKAVADGRGLRGCGATFSRYIEKGRVDYTIIPELRGVDLDKYRKDPVEKWRFTRLNEKK